jgi:hypothetical protein
VTLYSFSAKINTSQTFFCFNRMASTPFTAIVDFRYNVISLHVDGLIAMEDNADDVRYSYLRVRREYSLRQFESYTSWVPELF